MATIYCAAGCLIGNDVDGDLDNSSQEVATINIGETNVLTTRDSNNAHLLLAQQAVLGQPATIQSLSFYVTTAAGNLRLGIYDATGSGGGPGALKAQTNSFVAKTGWNTANVVTPVALAAGIYWLSYVPDSNSLAFVKGADASGVAPTQFRSFTFGAMPSTFGTGNSTTPYHWSFYATLTVTPINIGETKILPTADSGNANLLLAQQATLGQPATIQSLSFYATAAAGNLRLGIYDAAGANGGPGALKAQTNAFATKTGWNTANVVTPVALAAGTYWLAYLPDNNALAFVKTANGTGVSASQYHSFAFGAMPSAFGTGNNNSPNHWSLYATLIPTGGAPAATLSWTASTTSTVTGYRVYYGTSSGVYPTSIDVGNVTSYVIQTLAPGTYYFTVKAYNSSGTLSAGATEVSKVIH